MENTCRSCGGILERVGNYNVCKHCGNKWIIDVAEDVHAVDRANAWSALRDCDFERAVEMFENIIFKEPENHEAYWGCALASAGIMYVTDLNENKKVPTYNSISEFSFVDCKDVKKAIALAPVDIAETYKEQAQKIESIRIEWLKKASKEKPYDVFICFKDSDREHNIDRTDDSYDAHELYNALTAEGYKVFFSRVSLRDKVSEHYEPYIYNALKTAKVMIVFGEKPEYFNAVWVKNEWARFRAMIERGQKDGGSLVVVYKNMNPNDLPAGLRSRQFLDANEMLFFDSLKRHIEKIINASNSQDIVNKMPITIPTTKPKSKKGIAIALIATIIAISITFILSVTLPQLLDESYTLTNDTEENWSEESAQQVGNTTVENITNDSSKYYDTTESTTAEITTSKQNVTSKETPETTEKTHSDGLKFISNGDGSCYISGIGACKDDNIIIPDVSPTGDMVTSIGDYAFEKCSSIISITIPNSVTKIGYDAFWGCTGLQSINWGNSIEIIDYGAFFNCSSLTTINIPEGVTSIGGYAFGSCTNLTSITIPSSVTSFTGEYVFNNCTSLKNVIWENGIQLQNIGYGLFNNCSSLTDFKIPDGVTSIGAEAFNKCTNLSTIIIPSSITSIGKMAFGYCSKLATVYYTDTAEKWNDIYIATYNYPLTSTPRIYNYVPEE